MHLQPARVAARVEPPLGEWTTLGAASEPRCIMGKGAVGSAQSMHIEERAQQAAPIVTVRSSRACACFSLASSRGCGGGGCSPGSAVALKDLARHEQQRQTPSVQPGCSERLHTSSAARNRKHRAFRTGLLHAGRRRESAGYAGRLGGHRARSVLARQARRGGAGQGSGAHAPAHLASRPCRLCAGDSSWPARGLACFRLSLCCEPTSREQAWLMAQLSAGVGRLLPWLCWNLCPHRRRPVPLLSRRLCGVLQPLRLWAEVQVASAGPCSAEKQARSISCSCGAVCLGRLSCRWRPERPGVAYAPAGPERGRDVPGRAAECDSVLQRPRTPRASFVAGVHSTPSILFAGAFCCLSSISPS